MRYIKLICILLAGLTFSACDSMYDNFKEYTGEVVYPARFDTIIGSVGYERVEIDLMKAGRIPSRQIKMGKAQKVLITYDNQEIIIDSLVSWVNIKGLNQPKLYRFKIYTLDEFENKSVPQEIALIPYTATDAQTLVMTPPRVLSAPNAAILDWPNGLSSVLLDYKSLKFSYVDKDGITRTGERGSDSRFFINNLEAGKPVTLNMEYMVTPKVNNRPILDAIPITVPVTINMPTLNTPFTPAERAILESNGIKEFTAASIANVKKLTYPVHTNTLQDLFYFSNLEELDLTGGTLFEIPKLSYDRNGAKSTVGGGPWMPFMRKVDNVSQINRQVLKDLLETNSLKKVKYIPNSMGLDDLLAPYVASGIVELITLPATASIPANYFVHGAIQDTAWDLDMVYPATDAPAGSGATSVLKTTLKARSASFAIVLPKEYQFNTREYRYLKFKVFAPTKDKFQGIYAPFQRIWPRFMNYMWAFSSESAYGQEYWAPSADVHKIPDSDLGKWSELTIDMNEAVNKHNRVIVINIGGEPSLTFAPPTPIVYYFADFKLSKTQ